jgi:hypothetical protein
MMVVRNDILNKTTRCLLACLAFATLYSCEHAGESASVRKPGSNPRLIAAFQEPGGYSFIFKSAVSGSIALKFTYHEGFPIFTDTLVKQASGDFVSEKYFSRFVINDSVVRMTQSQKIVHPCYNWQGQAPWGEQQVFEFRNLKAP